MLDLVMKTKRDNMNERSVESYELPANATFASPVKYTPCGVLHVGHLGGAFWYETEQPDSEVYETHFEHVISVIPLYRREDCK